MHSVDGRLNANPPAPPAKVHLQAAVQWYIRLNDDEASAADQQAWQRWLSASPEHASAWSRVEKLQQQLHGVPRDLALPVLTQMGVQRRQGLKLLLLLAAGAATVGGYRASPYSADFATYTGQRRQVTLDDGSLLNLNTDSRVDIEFSESQRLIHLRQGEIFISTAPDRAPARPLSVSTPHGRILALGTRFDVRLQDSFTHVWVEAHGVEVSPRDAPELKQRLDAGQGLTFSAGQLGPLRREIADSSAWTQGRLVVIEWRLAEVIQELARYRPGYLGCADAIADLRISGAFQLDDTDAALASLQASLPVRVRRFSRYWVRVEA